MDSSQLTRQRNARTIYAHVLVQKHQFNLGYTNRIKHQSGGTDYNAILHIAEGPVFTTLDEHNTILKHIHVRKHTQEINEDPTVSTLVQSTPLVPVDTSNPQIIINGNIVGIVTTLAGNGTYGKIDGTGSNARLHAPNGITVDISGNIYVADTFNNCIRKITSDGIVTTVCGSGIAGYAEGSANYAMFNMPDSLAIDIQGNLYILDTKNNRIRKVTSNGTVSTIAGDGQIGYSDGEGSKAQFYLPGGITVDPQGTLYITDAKNHRIRKITPDGIVSTIAGNGVMGYLDGKVSEAQFSYPTGIAIDMNGILYVADRGNACIRKIDSGIVTTFAGRGTSTIVGNTMVNGDGANAIFMSPSDITIDSNGTLYIADTGNHIIRMITSDGFVSTLAGKFVRYGSFADGTGDDALFKCPYGIAIDPTNTILYVADSANNRIRKIV